MAHTSQIPAFQNMGIHQPNCHVSKYEYSYGNESKLRDKNWNYLSIYIYIVYIWLKNIFIYYYLIYTYILFIKLHRRTWNDNKMNTYFLLRYFYHSPHRTPKYLIWTIWTFGVWLVLKAIFSTLSQKQFICIVCVKN